MEVVQDERLELESEHGVPSGHGIKRSDRIQSLHDTLAHRFDVVKVEPRVAVLDPVLDFKRRTPRLRIDPAILGHEAGSVQFLQLLRERSVAHDAQRLGYLRDCLRPARQNGQHVAFAHGGLAEYAAEDVLEILKQVAVWGKARAADILCDVQGEVHLLKVLRNTAGNREGVQYFASGRVVESIPPEFHRIADGELRQDKVERTAAKEPGRLYDVVRNPARYRSAQHEYQFVMFLEEVVPRHLEIAGK